VSVHTWTCEVTFALVIDTCIEAQSSLVRAFPQSIMELKSMDRFTQQCKPGTIMILHHPDIFVHSVNQHEV
jgi:hypothetical protein